MHDFGKPWWGVAYVPCMTNLWALYAWVLRWHVTCMLSLGEHWQGRQALSNHVCAHSVISVWHVVCLQHLARACSEQSRLTSVLPINHVIQMPQCISGFVNHDYSGLTFYPKVQPKLHEEVLYFSHTLWFDNSRLESIYLIYLRPVLDQNIFTCIPFECNLIVSVMTQKVLLKLPPCFTSQVVGCLVRSASGHSTPLLLTPMNKSSNPQARAKVEHCIEYNYTTFKRRTAPLAGQLQRMQILAKQGHFR